MVTILNHSLLININNKIVKLIIEIVTEKVDDITILLWLNLIDSINILFLLCNLPFIQQFFKFGLTLYSDGKKKISLIIVK